MARPMFAGSFDHLIRNETPGDAHLLDDTGLMAVAVALSLGDLGIRKPICIRAGMAFGMGAKIKGAFLGADKPKKLRDAARAFPTGLTILLATKDHFEVVNVAQNTSQKGLPTLHDAYIAFLSNAPVARIGEPAVVTLDVTHLPDQIIDKSQKILPDMRARNTRLDSI